MPKNPSKQSPPKKQIQDFEGGVTVPYQTNHGEGPRGMGVLEEVASNEEIATRCQGLCGC